MQVSVPWTEARHSFTVFSINLLPDNLTPRGTSLQVRDVFFSFSQHSCSTHLKHTVQHRLSYNVRGLQIQC